MTVIQRSPRSSRHKLMLTRVMVKVGKISTVREVYCQGQIRFLRCRNCGNEFSERIEVVYHLEEGVGSTSSVGARRKTKVAVDLGSILGSAPASAVYDFLGKSMY